MIVVLTDGSNNRGVDPQTAAKEAADRGVRVFTIGYGISTIVKPILALAGAPWHVLLLTSAERVGKGIRGAPRDAMGRFSRPIMTSPRGS